MIYKRGRTWFIGYNANGRWTRQAVGESKKLAETVLGKRKAEIREGRFLDVKKNEKIKFEDFAETFLELHSRLNKRPRIIIRDEQHLKRLCKHFAGKYLYEITPRQIEEYKKVRKEAKLKNGKQISVATVNRELGCLKCLFNRAIAWGKAHDNPVRQVKFFKEDNKRLRFLERDEIPKFLDSAAPHLKPILIVALHTGMRKSEILTLQWKNINFNSDIIYLLQTKNGERREVLMNKMVKAALIAVPKNPNSSYVFCHEDGKPYLNVRKSFDATLKKCDIIDFRFHDLRHTFCSQLVMAGVDIKTVQELVGHKSIEMTLRYSHLSPDHKKKAIDILGHRISTNIAQVPKTEETGVIEELAKSPSDKEIAV